jgi:hypothetical protein
MIGDTGNGRSVEETSMREKTPFDWLMPSIADILFLSFFFKLLSNGSGLLDDGDTGWHIVTGENILRTFKIPVSDPYSHTAPGIPWTTHEWLADVAFASFHRLMGLNGVVLLSASVITLTFFFLYRFMLRNGTSAIIAVSFTIVAALTSTLHWLARPHIFSIPLTLAFLVILELYQREKKDHLKLLPLLMILWVNLHGGYVLGLLLVFLYAGGNLLRVYLAQQERDEAKRSFRALGRISIFTLLATFLNPHGPAILYFPFHTAGNAILVDRVVEWLSPNFHEHRLFEYLLLSLIVIFVVSRKKPDIFEGSVSLLLLYMSLYSMRFIPLFVVAVAPMAASRTSGVLEIITRDLMSSRIAQATADIVTRISENVTSLEARFRHHLWVYASIGACLLIALDGGKIGGATVMDYKHNPNNFPVAALDFALSNHIAGNMFNNDGWGGYIIYKSYPEYKVFLDGRSDMYGLPRLLEYTTVTDVHLGYEEILNKYGVTWVIFNANTPICQLLAASGKWKLVYADATANIFLKDIPQNRALIEKYKDAVFVSKDEKD